MLLGIKDIPFEEYRKCMNVVHNMETEELGSLIQGKVGSMCPPKGSLKDGCAIRMSYALNNAGFTIPFESDQTTVYGIDIVDGVDTNSWYYYCVADIAKYIRKISSNCTKLEYDPKNDLKTKIEEFRTKKGIIIFTNDDESGNVDLVENGKLIGYDKNDHNFDHFMNNENLSKAELYIID